ncbi:MAG: acetoacetate--CoA ligase [Elusimicrobia bacterium]|nr:acetoacetate--CoA ligase [Elusimicrobiota bacterium]
MKEGTLLWEPSAGFKEQARLSHFIRWLETAKNLKLSNYSSLWQWSTTRVEEFWSCLAEYAQIKFHQKSSRVLSGHKMPGAKWFEGGLINYAEHIFQNITDKNPAIIAQSELRTLTTVSWPELAAQTASIQAFLKEIGLEPGDRVAAYLPNIPEAVAALLATSGLGGVWSSCSSDFGTKSVLDRFQQIEPKVLFAVDGYGYGGKKFNRLDVVEEIRKNLPSLKAVVLLNYLDPKAKLEGAVSYQDILKRKAGGPEFIAVDFNHPLWILYSSGTTGLPKPIVHSQGGILLEHWKALALHTDLKPGDRFFWFTTTGWMMWNYLTSGLLTGSTILLYDGSPAYPNLEVLWKFVEQTKMNVFGTSASYVMALMKNGVIPAKVANLDSLRSIGSTGSPLPPEGFDWLYQNIKKDLWVASISGGTDLCTAFVGGCPTLPVYSGEIQCRMLGAKVEALDEEGKSLTGEVGELTLTEPMPSMPVYFWNDPQGKRYRESYFEMYPGIWRHGDWIKITQRETCVIYGRSDATLNRQGVRLGTSEIYSVVESVPEVLDSLIVGLDLPGGNYFMPLFVVLKSNAELDDSLKKRIKDKLKSELSPRHIPDEIYAVEAVPKTLNGKKLEIPIKKLLMGIPIEKAANPDSMANPQILSQWQTLCDKIRQNLPIGT